MVELVDPFGLAWALLYLATVVATKHRHQATEPNK